jgi:hypothetical protein
MFDKEKVLNIIDRIDCLHLEDPSISNYWDELTQRIVEL